MTMQPKIILVAEDEIVIRMMVVGELICAGFKVIEAGHAEEALAILRSQASKIHVLFTDIRMPGLLDGLALAHHARLHWPWIALLVASGTDKPRAAELPRDSRFLSKPYKLDHVLAHIRELTTGY